MLNAYFKSFFRSLGVVWFGRFDYWLFVSIMKNTIPPIRYIEQEHEILIFQNQIQILLLQNDIKHSTSREHKQNQAMHEK